MREKAVKMLTNVEPVRKRSEKELMIWNQELPKAAEGSKPRPVLTVGL